MQRTRIINGDTSSEKSSIGRKYEQNSLTQKKITAKIVVKLIESKALSNISTNRPTKTLRGGGKRSCNELSPGSSNSLLVPRKIRDDHVRCRNFFSNEALTLYIKRELLRPMKP